MLAALEPFSVLFVVIMFHRSNLAGSGGSSAELALVKQLEDSAIRQDTSRLVSVMSIMFHVEVHPVGLSFGK